MWFRRSSSTSADSYYAINSAGQISITAAGVAAGVAGLFMETHPKPAEAWSDGPNAVPLGKMKALLETLVQLDSVTKKNPFLEDNFA